MQIEDARRRIQDLLPVADLQRPAIAAIQSWAGLRPHHQCIGMDRDHQRLQSPDIASALAGQLRMAAGFGGCGLLLAPAQVRSEEHTSELQSLMRISYAVFCLKKKKKHYHR